MHETDTEHWSRTLGHMVLSSAWQLRVRRFQLAEPWRGPGRTTELTGCYLARLDGADLQLRAFAVQGTPEVPAAFPSLAEFDALASHHDAAVVDPSSPLQLEIVSVQKPWGRELWHTGIERRGISSVVSPTGRTPLPWALALAPERLCGTEPPILLKVLDPWPSALSGDLYLELHERKQEVYVVTHVDAQAWPDGAGAVRLGIDPAVRARYRDDDRLRADFLAAVKRYESVRREVDSRFDKQRQQHRLTPDVPVPPELLTDWHAELPSDLRSEEAECAATMNRFMALRPLRVGDAVVVPPGVPHSLLHGVRVVEFQSPVYERRIIAFSQKVLTQAHWDSQEAIASMSLDVPPAPTFPTELTDPRRRVERIAEFPDFVVWSVRLAPSATWAVPPVLRYALCIAVDAPITVAADLLAPERACLLPSAGVHNGIELGNPGTDPATLLLAAPREHRGSDAGAGVRDA